MQTITHGTLIVLNGTSSSGKSSISDALQELATEPFLQAGIDKFIFMLPRRYLNRPLWDEVLGLATEAGAAGKQLVSGMHYAALGLVGTSNHVLMDHVLVEPAWVQECAQLFANERAYLVGIDCPLAVLEQRERDRADRTLGQAAAQFPLIHAHIAAYDLRVDTSQYDAQACAQQILHHIAHTPPHAFQNLARQN